MVDVSGVKEAGGAQLQYGSVGNGQVLKRVGTDIVGTDIANVLPWIIDIDVFNISHSNVNWITETIDTGCFHNGYRISSGAQNDEIAWNVILAAGTWSIYLMSVYGAGQGIYSFQIDGVEKGTLDGYDPTVTRNIVNGITGVVISATGKVVLKLKMATKNASSSDYYGLIQHVRLIRTA